MKYSLSASQLMDKMSHAMFGSDKKPLFNTLKQNENGGLSIVIEEHDKNCAAMALARQLVPIIESLLTEDKND